MDQIFLRIPTWTAMTDHTTYAPIRSALPSKNGDKTRAGTDRNGHNIVIE
jgi:hypothetical protein